MEYSSRESSAGLCKVKMITKNHLWISWKKNCKPRSTEKMIIPLPIPHPAHIAVTIYNRDSEDPIPLESDICQNILQGIEDSHASIDDSGK